MKLNSLKKKVKQQLFGCSIKKNFFMIFIIKNNLSAINTFLANISVFSTETFSKQIIKQKQNLSFGQLKFPITINSLFSLKNFINFFLFLKKNNFINYIFLLKVYFFFFKKKNN